MSGTQTKKGVPRIPPTTLFTLGSVGLFVAKTLHSFIGKASAEGASPLVRYAVLPLLIVFALCFVCLIVLNIRDAKALKKSAGDVKYAVKTTVGAASILESLATLVNVALAITTAWDAYAGGEIRWWDFKYYFTLIILVYTFLSTLFFIISKTLKMARKAGKRKKAAEKAVLREERREEAAKAVETVREEGRAAAEKTRTAIQNAKTATKTTLETVREEGRTVLQRAKSAARGKPAPGPEEGPAAAGPEAGA